MKYSIFVFMFTVIAFISCDNELDLLSDHKEVPVVYGVIDQADTAQYIRVERVFVDPEVSGLIIAKDPDSLYYPDITVRLIRKSNGTVYTLDKVDGNAEGHIREEGVFAEAPNFLYKIKTSEITLVPGEVIGLEIEGIFDEELITSETTIVEEPFFVAPEAGSSLSFSPFFQKINIGWNPKGDEDQIFSVAFNIFISEFKDGTITNKRLRWITDRNTTKTRLNALRGDFFNFLRGQLDIDPDVVRTVDNVEFELITGGQSVADYIRVGQANLGITSSGEIPTISNLSSGLGLFGATVTDLREDLSLSVDSRDSLLNSVIMRDYNFQ